MFFIICSSLKLDKALYNSSIEDPDFEEKINALKPSDFEINNGKIALISFVSFLVLCLIIYFSIVKNNDNFLKNFSYSMRSSTSFFTFYISIMPSLIFSLAYYIFLSQTIFFNCLCIQYWISTGGNEIFVPESDSKDKIITFFLTFIFCLTFLFVCVENYWHDSKSINFHRLFLNPFISAILCSGVAFVVFATCESFYGDLEQYDNTILFLNSKMKAKN